LNSPLDDNGDGFWPLLQCSQSLHGSVLPLLISSTAFPKFVALFAGGEDPGEPLLLLEHCADGKREIGKIERGEDLARFEALDRSVAFTVRLSIHLDAALRQVDNPVVAHPTARVDALLDGSIFSERRLGHLDDQMGLFGMAALVIAERDHQDVRLWLRDALGREGTLHAYDGTPHQR